jgi:hypothetical protein
VPRNDSEIAFGTSEYCSAISMMLCHGGLIGLRPQSAEEDRWQEPLGEVIANMPAERRAKIGAAHRQKLIAEEQKLIVAEKTRRLERAKRVMELDRNLIGIAVIIAALPTIAALAWVLTTLAVGGQ